MNIYYAPDTNTAYAVPEGDNIRDSVCTVDACSLRVLHGTSSTTIQATWDAWKAEQKEPNK
jgi:hypothetical protein